MRYRPPSADRAVQMTLATDADKMIGDHNLFLLR